MDVLSQWEAELGKIDCIIVERRFLALIDLVRKKDEALGFYSRYGDFNCSNGCLIITGPAKEALALTEELK